MEQYSLFQIYLGVLKLLSSLAMEELKDAQMTGNALEVLRRVIVFSQLLCKCEQCNEKGAKENIHRKSTRLHLVSKLL